MASDGVKPISPKEVGQAKRENLPDAVIEAFNELIAQNYVNGSATILQKDVVALMVLKGLVQDDIYAKGWLDVEALYESQGWIVVYDKPGYNESYDASFSFKPRK